jgi:hypothetical protein
MPSYETLWTDSLSAFRLQAAWMIFIDGSGALSPMM